jgi:hypothetical protein
MHTRPSIYICTCTEAFHRESRVRVRTCVLWPYLSKLGEAPPYNGEGTGGVATGGSGGRGRAARTSSGVSVGVFSVHGRGEGHCLPAAGAGAAGHAPAARSARRLVRGVSFSKRTALPALARALLAAEAAAATARRPPAAGAGVRRRADAGAAPALCRAPTSVVAPSGGVGSAAVKPRIWHTHPRTRSVSLPLARGVRGTRRPAVRECAACRPRLPTPAARGPPAWSCRGVPPKTRPTPSLSSWPRAVRSASSPTPSSSLS